jgi:hypothetical protein
MLLGSLLLVVQDSAALEVAHSAVLLLNFLSQEAELRQGDSYSENSARNSGNIFAAGT